MRAGSAACTGSLSPLGALSVPHPPRLLNLVFPGLLLLLLPLQLSRLLCLRTGRKRHSRLCIRWFFLSLLSPAARLFYFFFNCWLLAILTRYAAASYLHTGRLACPPRELVLLVFQPGACRIAVPREFSSRALFERREQAA